MQHYEPYVDGGYNTEVVFVRCEEYSAVLKAHEDAEEVTIPISELYVQGFERLNEIPEGKIVKINAPYRLLANSGLI